MAYMTFSCYVMTYKMISDEKLSQTGQKKTKDKKQNRAVVSNLFS